MTASIMHTIGTFAGKSAATVWEGSRLAGTQFAQGAQSGYVEKAAELKARRAAVLAGVEFTPVAVKPRKIATAKA